MAIKSLVSSAWEEIADLQVPVSGAYETADHANALVNDAWQEVWSSESYTITAGPNCTISDGIITISFSWNDYGGNQGGCCIHGDFKAGEKYSINMTGVSSSTWSMASSMDGNSAFIEMFDDFYLKSSETLTKVITLESNADILKIYCSAGGQTGGSYTGKLKVNSINGKPCKYN